MLIQRFAAVALGIMMGTSLLLQTGTVLAAKSEAYYTTQKISDYKKGEFAVLADDDVNFRWGIGIWVRFLTVQRQNRWEK